jgi:hypothetical protein
LRVGPSLNAKLGEQCFLLVSIGQHNRSLIVLESIKNLLGFGKIHRLSDEASRFQFGAMKDINSFINQVNNEGAKFLGLNLLIMLISARLLILLIVRLILLKKVWN